MIEAVKPSAMHGVVQKVSSWLAFLNGHRVAELTRHPSLSVVEVDSLRQIYSR